MVYQGKYNRNKTAEIYHHDEHDDDVVSSIKNVIHPKYPKAFYPSFSSNFFRVYLIKNSRFLICNYLRI